MELARIGEGTKIWDEKGLWGDHEIGEDCTIGKFVEIGDGVRIGDRCKVEAFAFIPPGVVIEDDVFVGPHVCFANDRRPRATSEWERVGTVEDGVEVGRPKGLVERAAG